MQFDAIKPGFDSPPRRIAKSRDHVGDLALAQFARKCVGRKSVANDAHGAGTDHLVVRRQRCHGFVAGMKKL